MGRKGTEAVTAARYFTKEYYEEIQMTAQVSYPETESDRDEEIAWLESQGRSYDEERLQHLAFLENSIFHWLPGDLAEEVRRYATVRELPPEEFRRRIADWRDRVRGRWNARIKEYDEGFERIRDRLPENVQRVTKGYGLHDCRIAGISREADSLSIVLDCSGGFFADQGTARLKFGRVADCSYAEGKIAGRCWLNTEVYLRNDGLFEFIGLIDEGIYSAQEIVVAAATLEIEID